MSERRKFDRRDLVYYPPVFDRRSDRLLGYAANISPEGVMLVGEKPIEPKTVVHLRLDLPDQINGMKSLGIEGHSRWSARNGQRGLQNTGLELRNMSPSQLEGIKHLYSNPTLRGAQPINLRRSFDVIASATGLLLISPLMFIVALAIKWDSPGPTFYMANRVGKFGRSFRMYKFRTMHEATGQMGPRVTAHDDPRITRVGHFLRQTKLNELPQLLNVLRGEMSLVGPRPEHPEFVTHYSPEQREILTVKPGVTSLASIMYAGEEKMLTYSRVTETYLGSILPDKLRLDLLHVRNRSLLLDIDILFQTMLVLIPRFRRAAPKIEDMLKWPFRTARQRLSWFTIDAAIAFLSISMAGVLWRSADPIHLGFARSLIAAVAMAALFSVTNWLAGVQRIQWRYASLVEALYVIASAAVATILMLALNSLVLTPKLPPQMLVVAGVFAVIGFLGARFFRRLAGGLGHRIARLHGARSVGRERVLIVGAGHAAQLTISLLRDNPSGRLFNIVGIVDDSLDLLGTLLHRVPILGVCDQIQEIARQHEVGTIVFAIHNIDESRRKYLLSECQITDARMVIVPDLLTDLRRGLLSTETAPSELDQIKKAPTVTSSHLDPFSDLRRQIQILAEQAHEGDIDGVAHGLRRLDKMLGESDSAELLGPREDPRSDLQAGDQIQV